MAGARGITHHYAVAHLGLKTVFSSPIGLKPRHSPSSHPVTCMERQSLWYISDKACVRPHDSVHARTNAENIPNPGLLEGSDGVWSFIDTAA